jgi:hypothetical protein
MVRPDANPDRVQAYLRPNGEHLTDWFHITMRLTVLQQQTKALQEERSPTATATLKQVHSIKQLLWHGNAEEAMDRIASLLLDLDGIRKLSGPAEFETYIRNNQEYIPNYGELYRQGETISTAFVESTINQLSAGSSSSCNRCTGRCGALTCSCGRGPKS